MDKDKFASSYIDFVLYMSDKDPVLAEYYLARMPSFLPKDPQKYLTIRKNIRDWLANTATTGVSRAIPLNEFLDAVYHQAYIYTHGTDQVPANASKASRLVRILKLLKDTRYKKLQQEQQSRRSRRIIK